MAPAYRGVFDFRSNLYGDKHRAGLPEDVGQSGGEFLQFAEGESLGVTGAACDHVVVGIVGIGDRLAARRRVATIVDQEMIKISRLLLGYCDQHAEAHQDVALGIEKDYPLLRSRQGEAERKA